MTWCMKPQNNHLISEAFSSRQRLSRKLQTLGDYFVVSSSLTVTLFLLMCSLSNVLIQCKSYKYPFKLQCSHQVTFSYSLQQFKPMPVCSIDEFQNCISHTKILEQIGSGQILNLVHSTEAMCFICRKVFFYYFMKRLIIS